MIYEFMIAALAALWVGYIAGRRNRTVPLPSVTANPPDSQLPDLIVVPVGGNSGPAPFAGNVGDTSVDLGVFEPGGTLITPPPGNVGDTSMDPGVFEPGRGTLIKPLPGSGSGDSGGGFGGGPGSPSGLGGAGGPGVGRN